MLLAHVRLTPHAAHYRLDALGRQHKKNWHGGRRRRGRQIKALICWTTSSLELDGTLTQKREVRRTVADELDERFAHRLAERRVWCDDVREGKQRKHDACKKRANEQER